MCELTGSNDCQPREGGRGGRGEGAKTSNEDADDAAGQGEGRARGSDQKKGQPARSALPILIHVKGEKIQTNPTAFMEELAIVAGIKFCVRLYIV